MNGGRTPRRFHVTRRARWGVLVALLAFAYVACCTAVGALLDPAVTTDYDQATWPGVNAIVSGHPLLVYAPSKAVVHLPHPPRVGLDHGPLSLVPLSAVGYLLTLLGWAGDVRVRRAAGLATGALFTILTAREATALAEAARGEPFTRGLRLGFGAAVVCTPALGLGLYTHVELSMGLWLFLRSLRDLGGGRLRRSALMACGAMLTRSTLIFLAAPVALVILRRQGMRATAWWCGVIAAGVAVCMAPFVAADPVGVRTALVDIRAQQRIGHGSFLVLAVGTPLESAAQHGDLVLIVAALLLFLWLVRRSMATAAGGPAMFAVLCGAGLCFPLFAKSSFAYYLFESSVFAAIWLAAIPGGAARGRAAVVTGLVTAATAVLYYAFLGTANNDAEFAASLVAGGVIVLTLREIVAGLRGHATLA